MLALIGLPGLAVAQQSGQVQVPLPGQPQRPQPQQPAAVAAPSPAGQALRASQPGQQRFNTTVTDIVISAPLRDGELFLGDVDMLVSTEDVISIDRQRTLALLARVIEPAALNQFADQVADKAFLSAGDLAALKIGLQFNRQTLEISLNIPAELRATRTLRLSELDRENLGEAQAPAFVSGYLNARGAMDYVQRGAVRGEEGRQEVTVALDSAMRVGAVVLEAEGGYFEGARHQWTRQGTRFVYDNRRTLTRWTLGDIVPVARGFQGSFDIAGLGVFRTFQELDPQRNVRPRGRETFTITRPSTVEAFVNGRSVRRLRLEPGTYNASDFPFARGGNDVALVIEDNAGGRESLRFNLFFDRNQLAAGLTEFAFAGGIAAPFDGDGPNYDSDTSYVTGFWRRGFTDSFSAGLNAQASSSDSVVGVEALLGTPIGVLGFDAAVSSLDRYGDGYALNLGFERSFQTDASQRSQTFNASIEARSADFGVVGAAAAPSNPFKYQAAINYGVSFGQFSFASFGANYAKARKFANDVASYRVSLGRRLAFETALVVDLGYEDRTDTDEEVTFRIGITRRFGERASVRADYDSRAERLRLGGQSFGGQGVGAWNINADADFGDAFQAVNATANYTANRADLGLSHRMVMDDFGGKVTDERTSLRAASAVGFAGGAIAIGRPIFDSFAIVRTSGAVRGQQIIVEPNERGGSNARSGALGPALAPDLGSYFRRSLNFDVPNAPPGVDLGAGSATLAPAYRSGSLVEVGSDASVTVIGRLLDAADEPVSLLTIRATSLSEPDRPMVTLFTNREGQFGGSGLAPGRWRLQAPGDPPINYVIEIPKDAVGILRAGDLRPEK